MSDNGEEEEEVPVVELGDGPDVEGAPVSRVASRLFFPIEESEVLRREGETTVRTPDGPQTVADVLEQSDEVYFETNADLVNTVRSVVGTSPVPTAGGGTTGGSTAPAGDEEATEAETTETEATEAEANDAEAGDDATEEEEEEAQEVDPEDSEFEFDEE